MFYCTGPAKSQISSPRVLRILAPHLPRNNDGYDYTSQEFPELYVNLESNRKRGEEQESLSYPTTDVLVIEGNAMVAVVEWSFGGWNLL